MSCKTQKIQFLGIEIDNVTMGETVSRIEALIEKRKPSLVVTPNVQHMYILKYDDQFKEIYDNASLVIPDSTPILWATKLLGFPLKERVAGSDLLPALCAKAAEKGYKLFFLGSQPGVAKKAADILMQRNPGLIVSGVYSPPIGFEHDQKENEKIVHMIEKYIPDVLCVGLGSPKGEKWLWKIRDRIAVPVLISTGASFDFIAGKVKRAPLWMQKAGLEWLFRLIQEPRRLWKRYFFGNTVFIFYVFKEFIRLRILHSNKSR